MTMLRRNALVAYAAILPNLFRPMTYGSPDRLAKLPRGYEHYNRCDTGYSTDCDHLESQDHFKEKGLCAFILRATTCVSVVLSPASSPSHRPAE